MTAAQGIVVDADPPVVTITINRPGRMNALDPPAHRELQDAFDRFADDPDLRVAVITGAGDRAFCAGSDLVERARLGRDDMPRCGFAGIVERFDLDKPVIAAVNGHAIGGGLEVVLACDLALSVPGALFGLPEPRIGLAAEGGVHRLARQLPAKVASRIALTGELFPAATALEFGLINGLSEPDAIMADVRSLADKILAGAPLAIRATKEMMRGGLEAPTLEAAFGGSYPVRDRMLASRDAIEGTAAFLEKRPALWKGI